MACLKSASWKAVTVELTVAQVGRAEDDGVDLGSGVRLREPHHPSRKDSATERLAVAITMTAMPEKVMRISAGALREVEAALRVYVDEVIATDLSDSSKDVYAYHSTNFVRWLTGDFTPGLRPSTPIRKSRSKRLEADAEREKPGPA